MFLQNSVLAVEVTELEVHVRVGLGEGELLKGMSLRATDEKKRRHTG